MNTVSLSRFHLSMRLGENYPFEMLNMNPVSESVYEKVRRFVVLHDLIVNGDRIMLSLSAGKDSMALLDIMLYLKETYTIDLSLFHLNHMMRGEESDRDEEFLAAIAKERGLEIFIRRYDFPNNLPAGESFEDYARARRYELLSEICEGSYTKIATGHSRDDTVETILMRIFTGTGVHGLAGIRPRRGNIIHPLLPLSSKEIYEHLSERGISWREDRSNRNTGFQRNYVRHILIPKIIERFPHADDHIVQLGEISRDYGEIIDILLEKQYGRIYERRGDDIIIDLEMFIQDEKLFKFIIAHAIRECFHYQVKYGMLHEVYRNALKGRTHLLLYQNRFLQIRKTEIDLKGCVVITRDLGKDQHAHSYEYEVTVGHSAVDLFISEIDLHLRIDVVDYGFFQKNFRKREFIFVTLNKRMNRITVRNRRRGDRMHLEMGTKKIKNLMIDYKFDETAKNFIPLLVIDDMIGAFMPGLIGTGENRVDPDLWVRENSKKILAIYRIEN